jgi:hypothetical protein
MKEFLKSQWYDICDSVVSGYTTSRKPLKTAAKKELKRKNKIEMDFTLEGLSDPIKVKVGQCSLAKEIWNKLHNFYSKESLLVITEPKHDKE